MVSEKERKKILEMIENGTISAEEGLTLLNVLDESQSSEPTLGNAVVNFEVGVIPEAVVEEQPEISAYEDQIVAARPSEQELLSEDAFVASGEAAESLEADVEILPDEPRPPSTDEINRWKRWWVVPLWIGAGITVIGGLLMFWAFQASGFGFWFACAWFPFLLGVAVLALAWSSRTSPWLHVRVHQAPGERPQKIAISFPIPVRLTVWGLRTFGHYIPHMGDTSLDEVILALKDVAQEGTPLFVDVDEGENGERVQVFIG
jgi:hypothetical protein